MFTNVKNIIYLVLSKYFILQNIKKLLKITGVIPINFLELSVFKYRDCLAPFIYHVVCQSLEIEAINTIISNIVKELPNFNLSYLSHTLTTRFAKSTSYFLSDAYTLLRVTFESNIHSFSKELPKLIKLYEQEMFIRWLDVNFQIEESLIPLAFKIHMAAFILDIVMFILYGETSGIISLLMENARHGEIETQVLYDGAVVGTEDIAANTPVEKDNSDDSEQMSPEGRLVYFAQLVLIATVVGYLCS